MSTLKVEHLQNPAATTPAITIMPDGKVGIGVTAPGYKIVASTDLTGITPQSNIIMRLQSGTTGRDVNIQFSDTVTNSANVGMVGGNLYFGTLGSERMRIDSAGNVGIGRAPNYSLDVFRSGSAQTVIAAANGSVVNTFQVQAAQAVIGTLTSHDIAFITANTEFMRLDTGGRLHINNTAGLGANAKLNILYGGGSTQHGIVVRPGADNAIAHLFQNSAGGTAGQISTTATTTTYTTTSDYRLKEDLKPVENAAQRLMELKPVNFAWKVNGSRTDGFIAHEAQEVVPEAITGTKDAMRTVEVKDEETGQTRTVVEPEYQGIDQSKLVPLLTAALQEALKRIEVLEARVYQ